MELKKGETIMIDAALHQPASFLHETFSNRSGVPPDHFELYYRGKRLEGEAALASWGVEKDSTIEVKMRGRGGTSAQGGKSKTKAKTPPEVPAEAEESREVDAPKLLDASEEASSSKKSPKLGAAATDRSPSAAELHEGATTAAAGSVSASEPSSPEESSDLTGRRSPDPASSDADAETYAPENCWQRWPCAPIMQWLDNCFSPLCNGAKRAAAELYRGLFDPAVDRASWPWRGGLGYRAGGRKRPMQPGDRSDATPGESLIDELFEGKVPKHSLTRTGTIDGTAKDRPVNLGDPDELDETKKALRLGDEPAGPVIDPATEGGPADEAPGSHPDADADDADADANERQYASARSEAFRRSIQTAEEEQSKRGQQQGSSSAASLSSGTTANNPVLVGDSDDDEVDEPEGGGGPADEEAPSSHLDSDSGANERQYASARSEALRRSLQTAKEEQSKRDQQQGSSSADPPDPPGTHQAAGHLQAGSGGTANDPNAPEGGDDGLPAWPVHRDEASRVSNIIKDHGQRWRLGYQHKGGTETVWWQFTEQDACVYGGIRPDRPALPEGMEAKGGGLMVVVDPAKFSCKSDPGNRQMVCPLSMIWPFTKEGGGQPGTGDELVKTLLKHSIFVPPSELFFQGVEHLVKFVPLLFPSSHLKESATRDEKIEAFKETLAALDGPFSNDPDTRVFDTVRFCRVQNGNTKRRAAPAEVVHADTCRRMLFAILLLAGWDPRVAKEKTTVWGDLNRGQQAQALRNW